MIRRNFPRHSGLFNSGAGPFVLERFNIEGGRGVGYDVSLLTFFRRPLMPSETDGL